MSRIPLILPNLLHLIAQTKVCSKTSRKILSEVETKQIQ